MIRLCVVFPMLLLLADDAPKPLTLEEALAKEIHATFKLDGKRIDATYDFKNVVQQKDFLTDVELTALRRDVKLSRGGTSLEPGGLRLPKNAPLVCAMPLQRFSRATFRVTGVRGFSVLLAGDGARVEVYFGKEPTIVTDDDWFGGKDRAPINFDPKKTYELEIVIQKNKIVGNMNGAKVQERELPLVFHANKKGIVREPPDLQEIAFYAESDTGTPVLNSLRIRGEIPTDLCDVAATRGLAAQGKPPVFSESFTAEGKRFRVVSANGQEDAEAWQQTLDGTTSMILADHPADGTIVLEPTAKVQCIYRFASHRACDAYLEGANTKNEAWAAWAASSMSPIGKTQLVPILDGDLACCGPALGPLCWRVVDQLMRAILPELPWWLQYGNVEFYLDPPEEESERSSSGLLRGFEKKRIELLIEHIQKGEQPALGDLFAGWTPKPEYPDDPDKGHYNHMGRLLAEHWVRFLRTAEKGALKTHITDYYKAVRSGSTLADAAQVAFPDADLTDKFRAYLKSRLKR